MSDRSFSYMLERHVVIRAQPDRVFGFFTDSRQWAGVWGAGSTIDPRPGGVVFIRYPNGVEATGNVIDIAAPTLIVFTFGFVSGAPIPAGDSRVTIRLEPHADGTRLHLMHEFSDEKARDQHVQGWRYQLAVFANVVANIVNAGAVTLVDTWFAAWSEPDPIACERLLAGVASSAIEFRDRFSLVDGIADLVPHIGATHRFTPIRRLERTGDVRHCQGTLLADWRAIGADGKDVAQGTSVFSLDPDGRIQLVVSFLRS